LACRYLFVLYEKAPADPLGVLGIAMVLADGNFLNRDFELAEGHKNVSAGGFGSYGDAFVRTRKMCRFPNPLTLQAFRYRTVLVTEERLDDPKGIGLRLAGSVTKRTVKGQDFPFQVYELG
jgi:hypothetical protein